MDKVVKITEIASNSNFDDVILVQNHDKPNCFLPLDIAASNLDTNLNCDDKTIIPRELEHCDNAEIHNIDFFESSSNTKSTHHNCPVTPQPNCIINFMDLYACYYLNYFKCMKH